MTRLTVTTPSDREIVLARDFAAPSHRVFAALTRPELVKRWLGARGWQVVEADIDLRVGGAWRFLSRGPGGVEMGHGGVYREIDPGSRLVYTEAYDDQWYPGEALVTAVLAERAAGTGPTTTMITTLTYPSRAVRDLVLQFPMARGVGEGYDRLDDLLTERRNTMNWTLEVVVVPVTDVDRAKAFYADQLGFAVDHDTRVGDDVRFVQLTPPGSGCSIVIGTGMSEMVPGSISGLQLVVPDIRKAHAQLVEHGVEVSDVQVVGSGAPRPPRDGENLDNVGFVFFADPDGNGWGVQQISARG